MCVVLGRGDRLDVARGGLGRLRLGPTAACPCHRDKISVPRPDVRAKFRWRKVTFTDTECCPNHMEPLTLGVLILKESCSPRPTREVRTRSPALSLRVRPSAQGHLRPGVALGLALLPSQGTLTRCHSGGTEGNASPAASAGAECC